MLSLGLIIKEQALEKAVKRLKSVARDVKRSADQLKENVEELFQVSEVNGEKIPDVNEILKQVIDEKQVQHTEEHDKNIDVPESDRKLIRKHWKEDVVFTDAWQPSTDEHIIPVPEERLLQGELSAVIFQVGCYAVRSAQRVYKIYEPGYTPEMEVPAENEELERVRKDVRTLGERAYFTSFSSLQNEFRITNEISARHNFAPDAGFTYICRAAEARNASWFESIGNIYTVKENVHIPDEYASLLLCFHWSGSSFSTKTWYKFEPMGRITVLSLGEYGIMPDEAKFE